VIKVSFYAVFWREMVTLKRTFFKFFASRLVSPLLYLIAFGWGLGRGIKMDGGNYMEYVVPGIIALSAMSTSFNAVGTSLNISRLYNKTLEEYLIAPVTTQAFVLGKALSGVARGLIASLIILGLAFIFGAHLILNGWFFLVIILTCFLFSTLGIIAAMTINSHEDMGNFNTFIILPMSFLCGTFFSPNQLPDTVAFFIEILPLTHASLCLREIARNGNILPISLGVLVVYTLALYAGAVLVMQRVRD
jgi:Nod factor-specific ABC transporter NodJ protein